MHRHSDENPAPLAATESVATDSVQRQNDGRVACLLERLDEFGKRLDMSLAVPTVQEQTFVQEIPGAQVEERIQKQIAETIPQECVQRTVEQNVRTSVHTLAQMPKSLDRWLRKFELQNEEDEYIEQRGLEQMHEDWLMGAFEPTYGDDGRRERKSSKKKKKIVNRTVQVMERIPEHTDV